MWNKKDVIKNIDLQTQYDDCNFQDQELYHIKATYCVFRWHVHKRLPPSCTKLSPSITLVKWKQVFSWVTHVVYWLVTSCSRYSSALVMKSFWRRRVPHLGSWTFVFRDIIFTRSIELAYPINFIVSWCWTDVVPVFTIVKINISSETET